MQVKILKTIRGGEHTLDKGDSILIDDKIGQAWIKAGVAEPIHKVVDPEPEPEPEVVPEVEVKPELTRKRKGKLKI